MDLESSSQKLDLERRRVQGHRGWYRRFTTGGRRSQRRPRPRQAGWGNAALVHVVRPTPMLGAEYGDASAIAAAHAEMHDEGERICAKVAAHAKEEGVCTQIHNVQGDPADVLIKVAEAR